MLGLKLSGDHPPVDEGNRNQLVELKERQRWDDKELLHEASCQVFHRHVQYLKQLFHRDSQIVREKYPWQEKSNSWINRYGGCDRACLK